MRTPRISILPRFVAFAASCVLAAGCANAQQNYNLAAWGNNGGGQAWVAAGVTNVKAFASGPDFALAVLPNGKLMAWGGSASWQTNIPAQATNVAAIAASYTHVLVLRSNRTLVCWGDPALGNTSGGQVTNVPAGLDGKITAIAIGPYYSIALQTNGQLTTWGSSTYQTPLSPPAGLNDVKAIAAAENFGVALRSNGVVQTWGPAFALPVMDAVSNATAIAAGDIHVVVLRSNSTVSAWASQPNLHPELTNVPPDMTNVVVISAGRSHSLALRSDGSVVGWGTDRFGELNLPAGLTNITAVIGAPFGSFAFVGNTAPVISKQPKGRTAYLGNVFKIGCTAVGRSPLAFQWEKDSVILPAATNSTLLLTNVSATEAGSYRVVVTNVFGSVTSSVATIELGSLYGWGNNSAEQTEPPPGLSNPIALACGSYFSAALNSNGTVTTWGENTVAPPSGLSNVIALAAGDERIIALRSDGTVAAWGLAFLSSAETNVPAGLSNVIAVAAGSYHSLALRQDGSVVAWGDNTYGETNVPAGLTNVIAIGGGRLHSLAVKADGRVVAWGYNGSGQTNVPAGLMNVVAVVGGNNTSYALQANGLIRSWGGIGLPSSFTNVVAITVGILNSALALRSDGSVVGAGGLQPTVPGGLSNVAYSGGCRTVIPISVGQRSNFCRTPFRFISDSVPG
ncbi:MAG: hypothetical protein EXS35_18185 [Pedosphaera sp.]|nr:hypothetical protein [Pedosphaera sp.]